MIAITKLEYTGESCDGCGASPNVLFKLAFDQRSPVKDVNAVRLCPVCKHVLACRLNWYPDGKP